jgi:hypothetical protein
MDTKTGVVGEQSTGRSCRRLGAEGFVYGAVHRLHQSAFLMFGVLPPDFD